MSKIGVNILLVITMGTQKCPKKIVKVVTGPFKGSKFIVFMHLLCVGCDNLDQKRSKKFIIRTVII